MLGMGLGGAARLQTVDHEVNTRSMMTLTPGQNLKNEQVQNLPPKKRQELEILQRTKNLLFTKLEKLLDQDGDNFDDSQSYKAMDPSLAKKAEELSTYIDRVEEQI